MDSPTELIHRSLDAFRIEIPSWGFADTGTRFGKFHQPAAAIDLDDKLADASHVHRLTGCCPTIAVHVLWDFTPGTDPGEVVRKAQALGIAIGSINPTLFQDQIYKWGSIASPDPAAREQAAAHLVDSVLLGQATGSRAVSLWIADGTNYPGQDSIRARKKRLEEVLEATHSHLAPGQVLLIEYKPFEPAFYQTDMADWGMAFLTAKKTGPQAKVLVDTGHHYLSQNIEQIVAWLLDEGMLGGFHFNDRRYADDDLTLGSIDPYQIFRIFHEIHLYAWENGGVYPEIEYMIDQSHNLKPKIEAMIQTVCTAQELYAKAALVDLPALARAQAECNVVDAEMILKKAFNTDVSAALESWRAARGLAPDPLQAHRASGYAGKAAAERTRRRQELGIVTLQSYA
ncbi:MAG: xylA 1 [Akkermansiaceae bacterium]|nr:xylA 1 [Akkermansiaceae bacterium]